MNDTPLLQFLEKIRQSVHNQTFIKLTLSKPKALVDLKNIYVRLVDIKNKHHLSVTFRYPTRDEVKNYEGTEGVDFIKNQLGTVFLNAILFSTENDISLIFNKKDDFGQLSIKKASHTEGVNARLENLPLNHNKEKKRLLNPAQPYFHALEITDSKGNITPTGQKKFKQINKYIEIIDGLLKEISLSKDAVIADFGSGKGYLTFALYDHLVNNLQMTPSVSGFELRENLTVFGNKLANSSQFSNLQFIAQDISDYHTEHLDMLIALHACDTATDVAIAKGIKAQAKIIIVAPCCHKQIRKQLKGHNEMQPIMKHGIMEERQAEIITDGLRALLMEAHGYKTKVFEFISTEHTPKNVMIVGIKSQPKLDALLQIESIKKHYGIEYHALEKLI